MLHNTHFNKLPAVIYPLVRHRSLKPLVNAVNECQLMQTSITAVQDKFFKHRQTSSNIAYMSAQARWLRRLYNKWERVIYFVYVFQKTFSKLCHFS